VLERAIIKFDAANVIGLVQTCNAGGSILNNQAARNFLDATGDQTAGAIERIVSLEEQVSVQARRGLYWSDYRAGLFCPGDQKPA
jgi:hypothetical protein